MSIEAYKKAVETWLGTVEFTQKFTNEFGCVCNEIVFTAKNGNQLILTLFDVKPLNADNLDDSCCQAAEETMSGLPGGFPIVYSIMYTEEADERCGISQEEESYFI